MKRFIDTYKNEQYDALIVGGGITGAAVLYALASRGLKVALVEKDDFGSATSAATSKLIHGGLRYLKNLELGLVRESLQERRILANIVPNLVYPLPFMVPIYTVKDVLMLRSGMLLYDLLSYDKGWTADKNKALPNHTFLSPKETQKAEPNVRTNSLKKGVVYFDYQNFSPERMTFAFLESGVIHGGHVSNYTKVESFLQENETIKGVKAKDLLTGKYIQINANLVINCAGTWADEILGLAKDSEEKHQLKRSEGIHIVTRKLINKHAVTFSTKEGKHFMIMPWRNHSLIGTTDKAFDKKPDEYKVSRESIDEIIENVNEYFGDGKLNYEDILFAYGGLRPLVDDGNDSYNASRKYEIWDNAEDGINGLLTVEGGKYTTSRNLAEAVVKAIEKKQKRRLKQVRTDKLHLANCEIENIEEYIAEMKENFTDIDIDSVDFICRHYGTKAYAILLLASTDVNLQKRLTHDGELLAEVEYVIKNELAFTLKDILLRRTGIGTLGKPSSEVLDTIIKKATNLLGWDSDRIEKELAVINEYYQLPIPVLDTSL